MITSLCHHFCPAYPVNPRKNAGTLPADLTRVTLLFYWVLKNLVLRARSESNGSACINQPKYWSVDLKKRALNFQIFSRDMFSKSDEKRGFFHYSTTPILQYFVNR
jgi:hypothetical protein